MSKELEYFQQIIKVDEEALTLANKEKNKRRDVMLHRHWLNQRKNSIEQALKEHEQYKDIEKELGIDLFLLFAALKHGIYVKNRKNEIRRVSCNIGLVETGGHNSLGLRFQDTNYKWRYLVLDTSRDNDVKDYGKTWALTKEELL